MPDALLGGVSLAAGRGALLCMFIIFPHRAIEWFSPASSGDRAWLTQLELRVETEEDQSVEMSDLALISKEAPELRQSLHALW